MAVLSAFCTTELAVCLLFLLSSFDSCTQLAKNQPFRHKCQPFVYIQPSDVMTRTLTLETQNETKQRRVQRGQVKLIGFKNGWLKSCCTVALFSSLFSRHSLRVSIKNGSEIGSSTMGMSKLVRALIFVNFPPAKFE